MSNLDHFQKWQKTSDKKTVNNIKQAIVYTRVSSKEQYDTNLSLDFQKKAIEEYAQRNGITIMDYFGGIYESAKSDGRKEFQRMLTYIKKKRGTVSQILIYTLCRFSRTGGGAIKLAEELRDKYGIEVFAVTQPADTSLPSGELQQNIQFIFAKYDNQLRKQRAVAGMKEKFEKGIWCLKPPMGYDTVRTNGERKIVINKTGVQLRKAFKWKLEGVKSEEIIERLNVTGVKMYKQKLSMIFSNPFYCGIIVNKMMNGKLVKGTHPSIISEDDFLAVNNIRKSANKYGVPHKDEIEELPLKVFVKCDHCSKGYTGYIVKKKNIYYYKCRTIGCGCNKNAKDLNNSFQSFLENYKIRPELIEPLFAIMGEKFGNINQANEEQLKQLRTKLAEVQKKIDTLEEKYFILEEMGEETYKKFMGKYAEEKGNILDSMDTCGKDCSNLSQYYISALRFSSKLNTVWASSSVSVKEKIQYTIFPEGVLYNYKNQSFRTEKVNEVFCHIAGVVGSSGENEKGQPIIANELSSQVG
ncbi:MAG: recombinase family protein, partial [Chitinophagales bacterium]|nr:recombinase family protein [Chitinophagales bacterium]